MAITVYNGSLDIGGGGGSGGDLRAFQEFATLESAGPYALLDAETGLAISGSAYQVTVDTLPADFTGTTSITLSYTPEAGQSVKGTYIKA